MSTIDQVTDGLDSGINVFIIYIFAYIYVETYGELDLQPRRVDGWSALSRFINSTNRITTALTGLSGPLCD